MTYSETLETDNIPIELLEKVLFPFPESKQPTAKKLLEDKFKDIMLWSRMGGSYELTNLTEFLEYAEDLRKLTEN